MIELINRPPESELASVYPKHELWIDGKRSDSAKIIISNRKDGTIDLEVNNDELLSRRIAAHRFSEIPAVLGRVKLQTKYSLLKPDNCFYQGLTIERGEKPNLSWDIRFYLPNWNEPYSIIEYVEEFVRILKERQIPYLQNEAAVWGFSILFNVDASDCTINDEFLKHESEVEKLHTEIVSSLRSRLRPESVSVFFDFPEDVKVTCEQYLLYFGQFLKDLGVKADTSLTHPAGQVLFTITPTNQQEALDTIRSALDVFLQLPSSPIADTQNESIAVQRLEANILRLRSDLRLAAAELQAKDTTIQAQRLIMDLQKGLLSGEIVAKSVKDAIPNPEDKEHLIDGVVALSTYKEKGIEVNLGELLRRIKKAFQKTDDQT